jgi:polyisoprenoid-binding protein YceI
MSTIVEARRALPTGTWQLDPVHSSIGFEVDYMVGTFRGQFRDATAALVVTDEAETLAGSARVESVEVKDENLSAHLLSPEFFDAERHPELSFASSDLVRDGGDLTVRGEITIKGVTQPVELTGTITDPIVDPYGKQRIGVVLSGTIDRTTFGIAWNAPLPSGEPALANDVKLVADLYFVEQA